MGSLTMRLGVKGQGFIVHVSSFGNETQAILSSGE
jgi:hypothetical protein